MVFSSAYFLTHGVDQEDGKAETISMRKPRMNEGQSVEHPHGTIEY